MPAELWTIIPVKGKWSKRGQCCYLVSTADSPDMGWETMVFKCIVKSTDEGAVLKINWKEVDVYYHSSREQAIEKHWEVVKKYLEKARGYAKKKGL